MQVEQRVFVVVGFDLFQLFQSQVNDELLNVVKFNETRGLGIVDLPALYEDLDGFIGDAHAFFHARVAKTFEDDSYEHVEEDDRANDYEADEEESADGVPAALGTVGFDLLVGLL